MAILGRRSGKTTEAIEDIIDSCWSNPRPEEWPIAYIAPTYKQAKRITWKKFKQHFPKDECQFKESELTIIHKPTGCTIYLLGCDTNAETIRGIGLWHSVVDELKDISKQFLTEVLRPCFSDTGAGCLFIGTPPKTKGFSFEYYKRGLDPDKRNWISWNVSSADAGIIQPSEIIEAKEELDPETFEREYGAAFSFLQGLIVKHFSSENIQPVEYDNRHRLHITCDFNVDPCMWVLAQRFPPKYHAFDEVVKENTTVVEMVDEFARRYPPEKVENGITINGDASGNSRNVNTLRKNETSYVIMRNRLTELGYRDVKIAVHDKNPAIHDRIEAFNAKVMNANGQINIHINPRCKHLIRALDNDHWIEGTSDVKVPNVKEIEKERELKFRNHIREAFEYMVEYYDPIRRAKQETRPGTIVHKGSKWAV